MLGTSGALISQNCVHPDCSNLIRCGAGPQLLLRDGTAGNGDDSKKDRDQVKWNQLGNTEVPVSAGLVVSAGNPATHALTEYRVDAAEPITTLRLSAAATSFTDSTALETAEAQVIWVGGVTYALSAGQPTPIWSAATVAPPTIVSTTDTTAALSTARISVATATGLAVLDGNTGATTLRFTVPAPPAGSIVQPARCRVPRVEPVRQRGLPMNQLAVGAARRETFDVAGQKIAAPAVGAAGRAAGAAGARLHRQQGGLRPDPRAAGRRRAARDRHRPARPVRVARARDGRRLHAGQPGPGGSRGGARASAAGCACSGTRSAAWWRARR